MTGMFIIYFITLNNNFVGVLLCRSLPAVCSSGIKYFHEDSLLKGCSLPESTMFNYMTTDTQPRTSLLKDSSCQV